ncbi:hypothetical protein BRADI_3g49715v3 [Brachypodium distachyon]|uniref:Uncharacterized protein n=1 Tax=Brachypodium distachyon TaxID=15368 RepID=A0A2K2D4A1_BRADI|nr:hypothetical protein BRADI_3g49715v3 [Brachypodium distachyon]
MDRNEHGATGDPRFSCTQHSRRGALGSWELGDGTTLTLESPKSEDEQQFHVFAVASASGMLSTPPVKVAAVATAVLVNKLDTHTHTKENQMRKGLSGVTTID